MRSLLLAFGFFLAALAVPNFAAAYCLGGLEYVETSRFYKDPQIGCPAGTHERWIYCIKFECRGPAGRTPAPSTRKECVKLLSSCLRNCPNTAGSRCWRTCEEDGGEGPCGAILPSCMDQQAACNRDCERRFRRATFEELAGCFQGCYASTSFSVTKTCFGDGIRAADALKASSVANEIKRSGRIKTPATIRADAYDDCLSEAMSKYTNTRRLKEMMRACAAKYK